MFGAMTTVYFAEFEGGKPDAARHVIDFYAGDGAFDAFPQKVRDCVIATTASNILDWASATAFRPALADYSCTGYARIDQACLDAVAGGHFIPATENGKPIERTIALPIVWSLPESGR
jgi:hypothetical protein